MERTAFSLAKRDRLWKLSMLLWIEASLEPRHPFFEAAPGLLDVTENLTLLQSVFMHDLQSTVYSAGLVPV